MEQELLNRIVSKYWDFPTPVDEMRITKYDASGNPLIIEYYWSDTLKFKHILEFDVNGNLTSKKLIRY